MAPSLLWDRKDLSTLVIGLDNAGKTSILCHLANVMGTNKGVVDEVGTAPTVGLQLVEFRRRSTRWAAWDMSGQGRYRDLWASHAAGVDGVMFVVDVTDRARIATARDELRRFLASRGFRHTTKPVAILANKYDALESVTGPSLTRGRSTHLTVDNVWTALGVECLKAQRPISVFATSAVTREGIEEAIDWLTAQTKAK